MVTKFIGRIISGENAPAIVVGVEVFRLAKITNLKDACIRVCEGRGLVFIVSKKTEEKRLAIIEDERKKEAEE
jgi:hypothetical protein